MDYKLDIRNFNESWTAEYGFVEKNTKEACTIILKQLTRDAFSDKHDENEGIGKPVMAETLSLLNLGEKFKKSGPM